VLTENILCKRNSLDTIHVNPHGDKPEIVAVGDKYINLVSYEEKSDDEEELKSSEASSSDELSDADEGEDEEKEQKQQPSRRTSDDKEPTNGTKKLKASTDDYLNIF
jgi:hypothetical protein